MRSTSRKLADADALAAERWGEADHTVAAVWVVRATARNRALIARYPELFASRLPGSSAGWLRALVTGVPPPSTPGLVWASADVSRLYAWRRRSFEKAASG